jgi:hypothetical protein
LATTKNDRRLRRPFSSKAGPATVSEERISKAYLRNFGNGKLQFTESALRFYVEKGRLKKQKEMAKEIPLTNIDSVALEANELAVSWNSVTDRFVVEDKKLVAEIFEKLNASLGKPKELTIESEVSGTPEPTSNEPNMIVSEASEQIQDNVELIATQLVQESAIGEVAELLPNDLAKGLNAELPSVDLLFDVLGSFQGIVDWRRVKICAEQAQKTIARYERLKSSTANFNFTKFLSDIQERNAEAIPSDAYLLLDSIYTCFQEFTGRDEFLAQVNPTPNEAMILLQSYYILNDIGLAVLVGDETVQDEINQLLVLLESLNGKTDLAIDPQRIIKSLTKLVSEKAPLEVIEASRAVFKRQLKFQKKPT